MKTPFAQPVRPTVPDVDATLFQVPAPPIAEFARWRLLPPLASIATVAPSMTVPPAFFSVYVSLPSICGMPSALLM
jgi:hypothetical protein